MKRAGAGALANFGAKLDLFVTTLPRRNPFAFGKPDERCPLITKSPFHEKLVSSGTGPQFANSFVALNDPVPEATLPLVKRVIPVNLVALLEVAAVHLVILGTGNRRMLSEVTPVSRVRSTAPLIKPRLSNWLTSVRASPKRCIMPAGQVSSAIFARFFSGNSPHSNSATVVVGTDDKVALPRQKGKSQRAVRSPRRLRQSPPYEFDNAIPPKRLHIEVDTMNNVHATAKSNAPL